jgi:nucleoside-specific outer membrane channel protein Tsx
MFYPQMALLSFVDADSALVNQVKEVWEEHNSEKVFKWHKDINLMMSVNFLITDKIENSSVMQVSLSTAIETLIQAQQATMIATVSAVSVTTAGRDS